MTSEANDVNEASMKLLTSLELGRILQSQRIFPSIPQYCNEIAVLISAHIVTCFLPLVSA